MSIEREVKLVAPPAFRLPDLTAAAAGLPVATLPPQRLQATYFDTVDLRLIRWGVTVRYRTGDDGGPVWTVKTPAPTRGAGLTRRELDFPGRPGVVPPAVLALVRAFVRNEDIGPVAKLATTRHRAVVRGGDGASLLEVDDDVVSVLDGRHVVARFREVEVEAHGEDVENLIRAVVDRLQEEGAAPGGGTPKVVWALGPRATQGPEVEPVELSGDSAAGQVVRAAIATAVTRLLRHDIGARLGDDSEDVHQARVATRRLRSDLKTFSAFVDPEWTAAIRDELRWIAGRLGAVRDADVLAERLAAQITQLPEQDRRPAGSLLTKLEAERKVAREELNAAMESSRYVDLVDDLVFAARAPRLTPEADVAAKVALPEVVRRPWKHLVNAVESLGDNPEDEALHEVRIRAKRVRYAAEAVAPVSGKPAQRLATAVAEVQSVLGDLQDATVAELWLRSAALGSRGSAGLVAGELIGLEQQKAADSRKRWRAAWKAASKKSLRAWML
jgi:CHAD domain-containing protein